MTNLCAAFAAYSKISGEMEYIERAEECMDFQFNHWMDDKDGRPIFIDAYSEPREKILNDFSHSYYMMEALCWCHAVSQNEDFKKRAEHKLKIMIFGENGLLSQWGDSWFNYMSRARTTVESRFGIRLGWELSKSNGIMQFFLYYLNNIEENDELAAKTALGLSSLIDPLKSRMSGVMSDPRESFGSFALQSTGFAGLSIAEAIDSNSVFDIEYK
jgi:hypothetical protein